METEPVETCPAVSLFVEGLGCDRLAGHEGEHLDLRQQLTWELME